MEILKMVLFSWNIKIKKWEKAKNAIFGRSIAAKNSMFQIYSKYTKIVDFAGFALLPGVKKRGKKSLNLLISAVSGR